MNNDCFCEPGNVLYLNLDSSYMTVHFIKQYTQDCPSYYIYAIFQFNNFQLHTEPERKKKSFK